MANVSLSTSNSVIPQYHAGGPTARTDGLEVRSDGVARASQQQILEKVNRGLGERRLSLGDMISSSGMQKVIGKATAYANMKDAFVRLGYRDTEGLGTPRGVGSNHKAALRLADSYAQMKKEGAPDAEKAGVLRELLGKLETTRTNKNITPGSPQDRFADMISFVKHELSTLPLSHRQEAERLRGELAALKEKGGDNLQAKINLLTQIKDHLLGANPDHRDNALNRELALVHGELQQLEGHRPLKEEISQVGRGEGPKLQPTFTRESDYVSDLRAHEKHKRFMETRASREEYIPARKEITPEALESAKGKLKPTLTRERTGLEHAQEVFLNHSMRVGGPRGEIHENPGPLPEPSLGSLKPGTLATDEMRELTGQVELALREGDEARLSELSEQLGKVIAEDLSTSPRDLQMAFVTSHGLAFKDGLLHAMAEQLGTEAGMLTGDLQNAPKEVQKFLHDAYLYAARHLPDRQLDAESFVMNGHTYRLESRINQGGVGFVDLYTAKWTEMEDGVAVEKTHQLAVKGSIIASFPGIDRETIDEQFEPMASEVRAHLAAQGEGHPNVVGLRGVILQENGALLIAMDLAPNGDVDGLAKNLDKAEKEGVISQRAANLVRLTALKDMLEGMRHVQEERGMIHLDIKPANFLIGLGGRVQVGDFGQSLVTSEKQFSEKPIDNVTHMAPEVISSAKTIQDDQSAFRDRERLLRKQAEDAAKNLPPDEAQALMDQVEDTIRQLKEMREGDESSFTVTGRQDVWAIGVSAYQLFHGNESPFAPEDEGDRDYMKKMERNIAEWGTDLSNRVGTLGTVGGIQVGEGATELDRLLNKMLNPDPALRPSITELLASPIFEEPGVGSPEVRNLMVLVNRKDSTPEDLRRVSDEIGV